MSLQLMQKMIWQARIPLEIRLAASDCRSYDQADAYLVAWPRLSYLPLLLPRLHSFFSPYFIADPGSVAVEEGYFSYDGVPLKWHLPLGLIYDVYVMSIRDSASDEKASVRTIPFKLTLHYTQDEASTNVNWIKPDHITMHDSFINSVKEADFLRSGTAKPIMTLAAADSKALWSSTQDNDWVTFSRIHATLLPASGHMRNIPLRIYLPSSSDDDSAAQMKIMQSRVAPMVTGASPSTAAQARAVGGAHPQTLGTALHSLLPELFPSRRTPLIARPILHGAQTPLGASLEELSRWACYADGWLSVVISIDN